jgi:hypothetical protein
MLLAKFYLKVLHLNFTSLSLAPTKEWRDAPNFQKLLKNLRFTNLVHGSSMKIVINIWFINYVIGKVLFKMSCI